MENEEEIKEEKEKKKEQEKEKREKREEENNKSGRRKKEMEVTKLFKGINDLALISRALSSYLFAFILLEVDPRLFYMVKFT